MRNRDPAVRRALAGAGDGVVHAGAVAGFPMPVLRYAVGSGDAGTLGAARGFLQLEPVEGAIVDPERPTTFAWSTSAPAELYRLELTNGDGETVLAAVLQQGIGTYRSLPLESDLGGTVLRWRVVALAPGGQEVAATGWRSLGVR